MTLRQITGKRGGGSGEEVDIRATRGGSLHIAQMLPSGALLTALGGSYQVMSVTAVAALVVRPDTTAAFTLFNDESGGGKSYIVERAMAFNLVSTGAQTFAGIWLCVHPVGMTKPTADITAIKSLSGKSGYAGSAVLDTGATVIDDGWFPWGVSSEAEEAGVLPGGVMCADIRGRIIIPPQGGLSLHIVSGLVGDTFTHGFHWHEVQLDLG